MKILNVADKFENSQKTTPLQYNLCSFSNHKRAYMKHLEHIITLIMPCHKMFSEWKNS